MSAWQFPSAEFGEPLKLQPQPGSQLQNSRYVPESVQSAMFLRELDAEAAGRRIELVELDDRATAFRPGVVTGGDHEDAAFVRVDLGPVGHPGRHRSLDHVADVCVAA